MRVKGRKAKALLQGLNLLGKLLRKLRPMQGPPNLNRRTPMAGMPPYDHGPANDIREQANRARKARSKGHGLD